jgi:hypothetical protein
MYYSSLPPGWPAASLASKLPVTPQFLQSGYSMNFKQRISAHAIGILTPKDLQETAAAGLAEGYASETLHTLAELYYNLHPVQLEDYFRQALDELNISLPDTYQAVIRMTRYYICQILNGELDAQVGFYLIDNMLKTVEFYYADLGLQEAYEQYMYIADYSSPQFEPDDAEGMSREEAIACARSGLLNSLRCWLEQNLYPVWGPAAKEEALQLSH